MAAAKYRFSVAAHSAYCLVTVMLFALVVSVNPDVWLVNDPLTERNVRAVYFAPDALWEYTESGGPVRFASSQRCTSASLT